MLLVDSSVWVDYFTGKRTSETDYLDLILDREVVLVGDIILVEVLQGFRDEGDFQRALEALDRFKQVRLLGPSLAVRCASYYRQLRRKGITVRKTIDCIIATYCIETGCRLLHNDRDFDPFEIHLGLAVLHP